MKKIIVAVLAILTFAVLSGCANPPVILSGIAKPMDDDTIIQIEVICEDAGMDISFDKNILGQIIWAECVK